MKKALDEKRKEAEPVWDEFILALPEKHRLRATIPMSQATQYDVVREIEHREEFRRYLQKKAPKTPDGKVVVTLYVHVKNHKDSLILARELSRIGKSSVRDDNLEFQILSPHYASPHELELFQRKSGLVGVQASVAPVDQELPSGPFPLLTIDLPAMKKQYAIHGIRRSYFFEELIQIMSGREIQ